MARIRGHEVCGVAAQEHAVRGGGVLQHVRRAEVLAQVEIHLQQTACSGLRGLKASKPRI